MKLIINNNLKYKNLSELNGNMTLKRGPFGSDLKKSFFKSTGLKVYEQKNAINKDFRSGSYFISEEKFNELSSFSVIENDIIISCAGTIGEAYLIPKDAPKGIINQALLRIRLSEKDDPLYYYFYFSSNLFKNNLIQNAQGGVIKNIASLPELRAIKIIDIEKKEQQKISKILLKFKTRINKVKSLLEKIEIRNQYYADKLLSGELSIDEDGNLTKDLNSNLINSKVKNIFNVERGKVISKYTILNSKGIYPVYSSATLNNGEIGKIDTYMYDGKYITWTTDGVYAGSVFYREGKFNCTNICGVLSLKIEGSHKYFSEVLKRAFPSHVTVLGNNKLMSNTVENIEINYIDNIEIQKRIEKFLKKFDEEKLKIERLLELEEKRFEWLSDKLLSGEYIIED